MTWTRPPSGWYVTQHSVAIVQPPPNHAQFSMSHAPVDYRVTDGVAWITLDRPAALNALDMPLTAALADAAETAAADPDATVVVVRGAGRAFCSGMDRTALAAEEWIARRSVRVPSGRPSPARGCARSIAWRTCRR